MIEIIITIVIILFLLTLTMFFLLKRIVKKVNVQSKEFFTLKLQDFDDLVEERENKLNSIKEQENSLERKNLIEEEKENKKVSEIKSDFSFLENIPEYQEQGIFEKMKKIEEKFQINEQKIIEKFILDSKETSSLQNWQNLKELKTKLSSIGTYQLLTSSKEEEISNILKKTSPEIKQILGQYLDFNNSIKIEELLSFIELEIEKNDPTIRIETGEKNLNFSYPNVKVIHNPKIYKGIIIYYKNKKYDYSLS